MRKIFTTYHFLSTINSLLLILLINGCSAVDMEEESSTSIPVEGSELLYVSTRAEGGADAETAIRTLRLVVFSEDNGSMLLNRLFMTKDATNSIPDKSLTYFAHIGDAYKIATLIPKGTIRVVMIANEIETLDGTFTLDGLKKSQIKYYDTYHKDGALDIQLKVDPNASSNFGYLPMYAESRKLYYPDWNGFEKVVPINLVRTLAKVSLQITDLELPENAEKGTLIIKSASIINATKHSLWGDSISSYTGTPTNTITKEFSQKVTNGDVPIKTSDKLEFYIPGHVVSDDDLIHKGYTYIQINATFTPVGKTAINSTYEIPLGNGVEARGYELKNMTAADLKVSRNKIYQVEAKVKSEGVLSVISIKASVKKWNEENINGDIDPPCLNVSSINWEYNNDGGTNRIYFWSNVDKEKIKLGPEVEITKGGITTKAPIESVFEGLLFSSVPPTHFHFYDNVDESLYFHTNGYFDLIKNAAYTGSGEVIGIEFTAGKVTRRISVTMP